MPLVRVVEALEIRFNTPAEYRTALNGLLAEAGTISGAAETAMVKALDDTRAEVQTVLGQLALDSPSRAVYERALAGVNSATANLAERMGTTVADYQQRGLVNGIHTAVRPVAAGITIATAAITANQLQIVSGYSANLIQGVAEDLRRRINGELVAVVTGAKSPAGAAAAIGRRLTDRNHFSTIAHRARAIVVTEVGRAHALGTQAGQQSLAKALAEAGDRRQIRKRPINAHLPGARVDHLEAEARYAPDGAVGPIPIDAAYDFGGFAALYPRDPSLPASQSVNCHCVSITVVVDEPDPLPEPAKAEAAGAYTTAKAEAAAPAEIATKKHIVGKDAARFLQDPYTNVDPTEYGWWETKLGVEDVSDWPYDKTTGRIRHPKAPPGKDLPAFADLPPAHQAAIMNDAGLTGPQQSSIFKHLGTKPAPAAAPYAKSKPIVDTPAADITPEPRPTPSLPADPGEAYMRAVTRGEPLPLDVDREALRRTTRTANPDLEERFQEWSDTTDPAKVKAVHAYTGPDYRYVNDFLRGEDPDVLPRIRETVANLDGAIPDGAGRPDWTVSWRQTHVPDEMKEGILESYRAKAASGETVFADGMFSSSTDPVWMQNAGVSNNVTFEVYSKSGLYLEPITESPGEYEWLLAHGTEFEVIDVAEVTYGHRTSGPRTAHVVRLREKTDATAT